MKNLQAFLMENNIPARTIHYSDSLRGFGIAVDSRISGGNRK